MGQEKSEDTVLYHPVGNWGWGLQTLTTVLEMTEPYVDEQMRDQERRQKTCQGTNLQILN